MRNGGYIILDIKTESLMTLTNVDINDDILTDMIINGKEMTRREFVNLIKEMVDSQKPILSYLYHVAGESLHVCFLHSERSMTGYILGSSLTEVGYSDGYIKQIRIDNATNKLTIEINEF